VIEANKRFVSAWMSFVGLVRESPATRMSISDECW